LGQWTNQEELGEVLDQKLVLDNPKTRTVSETVGVPGTLVTSSGFETVVQSSKPGSKDSANKPPELSVAAIHTKSAWAKDEDSNKKKGGNASISLRAIQQAEAKKQESRKAAEREKEKARATTTIEDLQPFITSWGLPTSQAGARGSIALSARDVPPASPSVTAAPVSPVWTTPLKTPAVKKSMKEIQEEEERRRKQALRESAAMTTQKIAHADSTKVGFFNTSQRSRVALPIRLGGFPRSLDQQRLDDCRTKWEDRRSGPAPSTPSSHTLPNSWRTTCFP
jgi:hypothetical protein